MRNEDREAIAKMLGYCADVQALLQEYGADFTQYQTRISFQYACNMCIIQIGELVSRLSDECRAANPQVPWRALKAMRNIHAHDYDHVDFEVMWQTLTEEIPELKTQLAAILGT